MFSAKQFVSDATEIPGAWIFENYLGISNLHGDTVRIRSPFNPKGKRESLSIYYNPDSKNYRWKCFASGRGGDAIDYLQVIWNKPFGQVADIVRKDYKAFLEKGYSADRKIILEAVKWSLKDYQLRGWTKADAAYWPPYNISSGILEEYFVRPLACFTMSKPASEHSPAQEFTVTQSHIYGYFTKEGELYKIYQPLKEQGNKFIKVKNHLQGYDQLKGRDKLAIGSSLKDIMSMVSMNFNLDYIAPDSENTYLTIAQLKPLILEQGYKMIICVFDNDEAGIKAMKHYEQELGIPYAFLSLAKDVSDAVKIHGTQQTILRLAPAMHKAFDKFDLLQDKPIPQLIKSL